MMCVMSVTFVMCVTCDVCMYPQADHAQECPLQLSCDILQSAAAPHSSEALPSDER